MARPFGIRNKKQNDNNKTTIRWSSNDRCDLAHSRVVQILRKSKSATCSYHVDFRDVTDAWDEHSYADFHWVSYAHATDKCVDKCDDMCIRLHTIPALDRQTQTGRRTDGRTDGRIFRNNIALCMHHNASTRFTWNLERVQESFYIILSNRPQLKINPLLVEISLSFHSFGKWERWIVLSKIHQKVAQSAGQRLRMRHVTVAIRRMYWKQWALRRLVLDLSDINREETWNANVPACTNFFFSILSLIFCLVPCGRLNWRLKTVNCWSHSASYRSVSCSSYCRNRTLTWLYSPALWQQSRSVGKDEDAHIRVLSSCTLQWKLCSCLSLPLLASPIYDAMQLHLVADWHCSTDRRPDGTCCPVHSSSTSGMQSAILPVMFV